MKRLKAVFESLGFNEVRTYINSGNVLFEGVMPQREMIEKELEKEFSFVIPTLIRTKEEIATLCHIVPNEWENNTDMKTDILFLWEDIDSPDILKEIPQNPTVDTLVYIPGAIIWHIDRARYKESMMNNFITTKVYKKMTARNINTVRKLNTLFQ